MTNTKPVQISLPEQQVNLIKATFKDNEYLLKAMRNLFFGFPVSEEEKTLIKGTFSGNTELKEVVRKKIYPVFSDTIDLAVGNMADYWLDVEKDILGAFPDAINQRVSSKQQVSEMLAQAITLLENPDGTKVDLSYNPKLLMNDPLQINLLARSLYIRTIGQGLTLIKMIADMKEETVEEKKKRIQADSSK